jgi:hypothetical protein
MNPRGNRLANGKIYREGLIRALADSGPDSRQISTGSKDFATLLSAFLDVLNFDDEYLKRSLITRPHLPGWNSSQA